jgi:serine/threonine-protein kinase
MTEELLGQTIANRYRIVRLLGRGGFGAVYLAHDQQVRDKNVVLKVLLKDSPTDPWFRKKFDQEIEALARINHPGVVPILDAGTLDDGKPFLVMSYIEGYTLRNAISNLGLELPRAASIIRQAAQAIEAAHQKGITHRDLKPENVMLTRLSQEFEPVREHVTLIDFGIASVRDSQFAAAEKTRMAGSFAYMASEQLDGRPTPQSDLYALAVLAYEMLTGNTPFSHESLFKFLSAQRAGLKTTAKNLRPEVPPAADALITQALSFRAEDRPQRIKDFGEQLATALEAPAPKQEAGSRAARPAIPWDRLKWLVAGGLTLVAVLAIWGVRQMLNPAPPARKTSTAAAIVPARELSYSIRVQRYRDGKPYRDPFLLAGAVVFEEDYRIRLQIQAAQEGHLYMVNEGPEKRNGLPEYALLFPTPTANGGSPLLRPGSEVAIPEASEFRFDGQTGEEKVWLIWSAGPHPPAAALEAGKVETDAGRIQALEKTLAAWSRIPSSSYSDEGLKRTTIKAQADPLVHLIRLSHH